MKKLNGLFLDDMRTLEQAYTETQKGEYLYLPWDVVRSYDEFVEYVQNIYAAHGVVPELISFDHDLDIEHYKYLTHPIPYEKLKVKTGWHCAKFLKEFCTEKGIARPKKIMIHTRNPAGYENIVKLFF